MPSRMVWSANGTRVLAEDYYPDTSSENPPVVTEVKLHGCSWTNILKGGITWSGKDDQEKAVAASRERRKGRITKRQRNAIAKRKMIIAGERGVKTAEEQAEILRLAAKQREIDRIGKNYNSLKK